MMLEIDFVLVVVVNEKMIDVVFSDRIVDFDKLRLDRSL